MPVAHTGEWSSAEQQFNREWDALADQVEREEVMKALTTDDDNRKTPVQQNAILEDQLESTDVGGLPPSVI
jgi:hypothetical protein